MSEVQCKRTTRMLQKHQKIYTKCHILQFLLFEVSKTEKSEGTEIIWLFSKGQRKETKRRDCLMRVEFPWSNKTCIMFYKFITEEEALDLEKPSLQRTLQKDWHSHIRYNAGALPCYKLLYRSKGFEQFLKGQRGAWGFVQQNTAEQYRQNYKATGEGVSQFEIICMRSSDTQNGGGWKEMDQKKRPETKSRSFQTLTIWISHC